MRYFVSLCGILNFISKASHIVTLLQMSDFENEHLGHCAEFKLLPLVAWLKTVSSSFQYFDEPLNIPGLS